MIFNPKENTMRKTTPTVIRKKTPTSFTLDNKTLGKLKKLAGTKKVSVSHLMSQAAEKLVAKM
jgi:predicted DNA-binding ribbon-helix-helix protein